MSGVSMDMSIEDAAVLAGFDALAALTHNMMPVMDDIGASMVISTQARFETGIGPDGVPWEPSARAEEVNGQTLVDSARLVQSITHEPSPMGVVWGTDVIYGRVHQTGETITAKGGGALRFKLPGGGYATVNSVTIPARPFLGVDAGDDEVIAGAFIDAIHDAFNAGSSFGGAP